MENKGEGGRRKGKNKKMATGKRIFFLFFSSFFFLLCFPKHFICCKDNFAKILWVIGENEERVRF